MASYLLLSAYIFAAAASIEFLNYRAGGILPRKDYRNNDPENGLAKWQYRTTVNIEKLDSAPAHVDNVEQMQAQRENRLHSAVIKLGLPQYPLLALAGLFFAAVLLGNPASLTKKCLCLIAICCLLNILSFAALLERDYFGSLGW